MNNDWRDYELVHYGILGMKWGQRRYQNPDGSLTAEGKERYYKQIKRQNRIDNAIRIGSTAFAFSLLLAAVTETRMQIGESKVQKLFSSHPIKVNPSLNFKDLTMSDLEKLDLW